MPVLALPGHLASYRKLYTIRAEGERESKERERESEREKTATHHLSAAVIYYTCTDTAERRGQVSALMKSRYEMEKPTIELLPQRTLSLFCRSNCTTFSLNVLSFSTNPEFVRWRKFTGPAELFPEDGAEGSPELAQWVEGKRKREYMMMSKVCSIPRSGRRRRTIVHARTSVTVFFLGLGFAF